MSLTDSLAGYRPKTYKRASNASYAVGIVGLLVGTAVGQELLGFAVFILGFVGGVGAPHLSDRSVYDERDQDHLAETSGIVLSVWGFGGLVLFVTLSILGELGWYAMSAQVEAAFYTWSAFWVFFTITHLFTLYRRR